MTDFIKDIILSKYEEQLNFILDSTRLAKDANGKYGEIAKEQVAKSIIRGLAHTGKIGTFTDLIGTPHYKVAKILKDEKARNDWKTFREMIKREVPTYRKNPHAALRLGSLPWRINFELMKRQKKEKPIITVPVLSVIDEEFTKLQEEVKKLMTEVNYLHTIIKYHAHNVYGKAVMRKEEPII